MRYTFAPIGALVACILLFLWLIPEPTVQQTTRQTVAAEVDGDQTDAAEEFESVALLEIVAPTDLTRRFELPNATDEQTLHTYAKHIATERVLERSLKNQEIKETNWYKRFADPTARVVDLQQHLETRVVPKTRLIEIRLTARSAESLPQVMKTIVEAFREELQEYSVVKGADLMRRLEIRRGNIYNKLKRFMAQRFAVATDVGFNKLTEQEPYYQSLAEQWVAQKRAVEDSEFAAVQSGGGPKEAHAELTLAFTTAKARLEHVEAQLKKARDAHFVLMRFRDRLAQMDRQIARVRAQLDSVLELIDDVNMVAHPHLNRGLRFVMTASDAHRRRQSMN